MHIPSIPQAGGFTITSTPAQASSSNYHAQEDEDYSANKADGHPREPYIELAVQNSPTNPPAAWLWKPESQILGTELSVRVGGSFVWPPPVPGTVESVQKVVFVAGGVGIKYVFRYLISYALSVHEEHRLKLCVVTVASLERTTKKHRNVEPRCKPSTTGRS